MKHSLAAAAIVCVGLIVSACVVAFAPSGASRQAVKSVRVDYLDRQESILLDPAAGPHTIAFHGGFAVLAAADGGEVTVPFENVRSIHVTR